jgi:hypothetical protein
MLCRDSTLPTLDKVLASVNIDTDFPHLIKKNALQAFQNFEYQGENVREPSTETLSCAEGCYRDQYVSLEVKSEVLLVT